MNKWFPDYLPEDIEAERTLLATCCASGAELLAADIILVLTDEDFIHPAHKLVFKALKILIDTQVEVNSITIKSILEHSGDLSRVGGYTGLVELLSVEEVSRPQILSELLIRKRKLRQLIKLGAHIIRQAMDEVSPELLIEQTAVDLCKMATGTKSKELEHIGDVARDTMELLLDRLEGRGASGLKVGFSRLDYITQGFHPGNLIILAARPGIGKTALALNWILRSAMYNGTHSAFFSLEMSKEEVFNRLLSAHSTTNMKAVQAGDFNEEIQARLLQSRDALLELPIYINDQAGITIREITAIINHHLSRANNKLDMIIVDYLQLMTSVESSRSSRQNESVRIGEISRAFKLLAKEYNIPVIVLSQLNREVEHRQGGRPQLSDLRDSGAIEQDADIVMFIHRSMKNDCEDGDRSAELLIAKHRNGPTGTVSLYFEGEYARYRELERNVL